MEAVSRRRISPRAWRERELARRAADLFNRGWFRVDIAAELSPSGSLDVAELLRYAERLGLVTATPGVRARRAKRPCLSCGRTITSTHKFHRLCDGCRERAGALPAGWA